eukprot:gene3921-13994_t
MPSALGPPSLFKIYMLTTFVCPYAQSAMARLRNADKGSKAGSQKKSNEAALTIMCEICRATFISNSSEMKLKEHFEQNKAPRKALRDCFPKWAPTVPEA